MQKLKATVSLVENFPLDLRDQILPIIDLMVNGVILMSLLHHQCVEEKTVFSQFLVEMADRLSFISHRWYRLRL